MVIGSEEEGRVAVMNEGREVEGRMANRGRKEKEEWLRGSKGEINPLNT